MSGHARGMVVCLFPLIRCGFCLQSPGLLPPTLMSRLTFPPGTLEPLLLHKPDLLLLTASVLGSLLLESPSLSCAELAFSVPLASTETLLCHGGQPRSPDLSILSVSPLLSYSDLFVTFWHCDIMPEST